MYAQGKRTLVRGGLLLLLGIPAAAAVYQFGVAYATKPELWDGDRVETRACRQCMGSGKEREDYEGPRFLGDRCSFCAGKGTVDVIVPGPRRPTRIWGAVVDAAVADGGGEQPSGAEPDNLRYAPMPFGPGLRAPRGGIPRAAVVFRPESGEEIRATADEYGRFSHKLPPGSYRVRASAPGFGEAEGVVVVRPLTEPIWLEKANLVAPEDPESSRGKLGLNLKVSLPPRGEEGGSVHVWGSDF